MLLDETRWTMRMIGAMLLASLLVWLVTDKPYLGVFAAAALLLSAWHLWIPREFAIDLMGLEIITLGRRRRIGWDAIRRVEMMNDGMLFSFNRRAGTGKKLVSIFIPHKGDRTRVTKAIAEFIARKSGDSSIQAQREGHAKKHAT